MFELSRLFHVLDSISQEYIHAWFACVKYKNQQKIIRILYKYGLKINIWRRKNISKGFCSLNKPFCGYPIVL